MKYIFLAFLLFTILGCDKKEGVPLKNKRLKDVENDAFFPEYKKGDVKPDTLYLDVRLDDCGEWGGPQEKFRLYVDSKRQYLLEYKRYRFNCDSIGVYYAIKNKPLEYENTIVLTAKQRKTISDFLGNLMEAKISEQVYSNSGSVYRLYNSDSTLNVEVYSEKEKIMEDFYHFKLRLGLPDYRRDKKEEEEVIIDVDDN